MKLKFIPYLVILLIFNACIVLSLNPFFTNENTVNDPNLNGNWIDESGGTWEFSSFQDKFLSNKIDGIRGIPITPKDSLRFLKKFKNAVVIDYTDEAGDYIEFIGMPFKLKGELFMDFYLTSVDGEINDLAMMHLIGLHSLAIMKKNNTENIEFNWLGQEKLNTLIEQNKIKIKYEEVGPITKKYVLTADSEDLEKFIYKYISSDIPNKWDSGEEQVSVKLKKTK